MPDPARAHLLLPTPVGLVHYDLLEETAFVGPGPKGGLTASPTPFREARLVLSDDGSGLVVRGFAGEAPPDVNGSPAEGRRLEDGDRVRLGDHVALVRIAPAVAPAVATALTTSGATPAPRAVPAGESAAGVAPPPRPRRAAPAAPSGDGPGGLRHAATALGIVTALLLLFAVYRAVQLLQTPEPRPVPEMPSAALAPPEETVVPRAEERAAREYAAAKEFETSHPTDLAGAADRYRAIAEKREFEGNGHAARAAARHAEIWPRVAAQAWESARSSSDAAATGRRYRTALQALEDFEARFAGTPAAQAVPARREAVRAAARKALDALRDRVAPLLASDATRAYRLLTTSGLELPPDLDEELGAMMRRARELWPAPEAADGAAAKRPPTGREGGAGPTPGPRPGSGPAPGPAPGPGAGPEPGAGSPGDAASETAARQLWMQAKADLDAKRWTEARKEYGELLRSYGGTAVVAAGKEKIRAGRRAADYALRGPAALLHAEATWKNGRLEAEWSFDDARALEDFSVEQPFAGDEPLSGEVRSGMAILSGSTAMLLKVVFDPTDVMVEAECTADEHRDYGLIALQESNEYRAAAMNVGNTQFRLKKGSAAKVLPGHVLWLYGDGVWRDADAGERGFVRIAVKNSNGLRPQERATVKFELHQDKVSGEVHGKSDTTDLSGKLLGDDGKGIGPARVGAFAYTGRVGVDRLKIVGKPDAAWLAKQMGELLAAASGPD